MRRIFLIGALVAGLSTGCDPATGVVRTVKVAKAPTHDQVETALRDVVGTNAFHYQRERDADAWSIGTVVLEIRPGSNGATLQFRNLTFGSSTLADVASPRKLMDDIYENLCKQAPDLPPSSAVQEKLIRVRKK